MNMIFPQILLHYFMHLQFKFDIYVKISLSIIVKNSKLIETCINLKYGVQSNVLVVEKLKEVQKTNLLEILCRVP
jgi:hypothetical protein